jgi:hypothetical protein
MRAIVLLSAFLLAACVSDGTSLQPGISDAAAVRAAMGQPAEVLKTVQGGEVWFYPRGRVGRQTFRAELAPDGRLQDVEQVLHEWNFDRVIAGKTTREELRRLLGPPEMEWLAMNGWETIWDYHYTWAGQPWVVHFGIDQKGVVTGQHRRSEINDPGNRL